MDNQQLAKRIVIGFAICYVIGLQKQQRLLTQRVNKLIDAHNNRIFDERFAGIVKNYDTGSY
jgi:hypothetical protein